MESRRIWQEAEIEPFKVNCLSVNGLWFQELLEKKKGHSKKIIMSSLEHSDFCLFDIIRSGYSAEHKRPSSLFKPCTAGP